MNSRKRLAIVAIATSALFVSASPAFAESINGSGATFALPLIDACKADFSKDKGHTVNYPGGGSGKGRTDFASNLVDFAGSDAPYSSGAPANLVYAPIYAAPIAVMYNLPTVKEPIYLTPATIAKIFSGYITDWSAPEIAADNERVVKTPIYETKKVTTTNKGKKVTKTVPVLDKNGKAKVKSYNTKTINIDLPKQQITVWYRTDSSGTSENFTKFLKEANASNPDTRIWPKTQAAVFANATPNNISTFFNFQGASGSAAVSAGVAGKVGSITYSEVSFATANKLPVAYVQNANGEFVAPDAAGTSIFLGGGTINDNGTVSVDFAKKIPGAYPLGTTSYGLAYSSGKDAAKQKAVAEWFTYVLEQCPTKYPEKGFAQITGPLATKAKEQIAKIK
ncbi:MAG: phosphate ABC transporter substrate-binding protein PstS [Actinobacteria bacterium]|jgi:phosphate transport system substrate-binding protein|nr:phosphate ABC transporter substrate-binding protein PstS [Actinomycetota bacterium]NDA95220.1 phosphate ABC transporter substrate-binding protein PstS [Actinomycetota bacterium]NDH99680.1 phosphate ABC transporter substrate-binding protein PstS [Actinomycetota bacterium]